MTTETDIANMALDILVEAPIGSFDDNRPVARWFRRNFAQRRQALLSKWEWNFAIRRVALAQMETRPAFGWSRQYAIPSDYLRILPLTQTGHRNGRPIDYEVENDVILTDAGAPLRLRYIVDNVNYDSWSSAAIDALKADLARMLAHWITGKTGFYQIASDMFNQAISEAWLIDAVEGTVTEAADNDWIDARNGVSGDRGWID